MKLKIFATAGFVFFYALTMPAQPTGMLAQLQEEEQNAIQAIALYPQKERTAILEASMHPEILVRMENIRRNTEKQFKDKITNLPEEDQRKIYNLVRYPDLVDTICTHQEKLSHKEMTALLQAYPVEIHEDAEHIHKKYFDLLKDIQHLYKDADNAFQSMLSSYPEPARQAYWTLLNLPGVVTILIDHISMTVLLGDIYKSHPQQLIQELDSLNIVVAEQQANELKDWKTQLEQDPEATREFEEAAQEFAHEQGYDDVYQEPAPQMYADPLYVEYVWQPYPYWFGWPYWYSYPCWYPYPYWYHWGYYYGPGNVMFVVGMPSGFFIGWTFYDHHHFYHYPHFTDQVIDHYYGPRHSGATVQPVLRSFEEEHKSAVPADWFKDPENRVERIKEYGKLRIDYDEAVRVAADKAPTEREFLKDNVDRYPALKPALKQPVQKQPQPARPREYEPFPKGLPEKYVPKEKVIEHEKIPRPETIDRAKETHEKAWDKIKSQPRYTPPRPPQQTAPPRQAPSKAPSPPRQSAPPRKN
jgi:hypothetical protein